MYSTALVFEETFAKTAFAVVSCAVPGLSEFYSPVCFYLAILGVRYSRRSPAGLDCSYSKSIRSDCFCSCKLRYCRAECVLLLGCNVQSDIVAVMIAWS